MSLFKLGKIILNSEKESDFKIECDALTDEDIECLAAIIAKKFSFRSVNGVPTGGDRLANALRPYITFDGYDLPDLLVDDVLTTGESIKKFRDIYKITNCLGIVIFARGECPRWVHPLFQLNPKCY